MKVNLKQYAIVLHEVTKDLKGAELESVLKSFINLLAKKNLLSQLDKILAEYEKYYNQINGIINIKAKTAQPLSQAETKTLAENLKKITGKEIELKNTTDQDLIGGIILQIDDNLIDGSIKNQLEILKQKMAGA
jgi:F-type H+-transporting ATPase subunit delta